MRLSLTFILAAISITSAAVVKREAQAVRLAVKPKCGTFSGDVADVNAGLKPLNAYKTIVAFGDAYSDGGVQNGSPLKPAVVTPPSPLAGGRSSDGPIWLENLAVTAGATLKDYATAGAVIDSTAYPGLSQSSVRDLSEQVNFFTGQGVKHDPETTLYTIFFGINDFELGTDLDVAAQNIAYRLLVLSSSPTFAKNILVVDNYGRGKRSPEGEAFKQQVFSELKALRSFLKLNIGFVDLSTIWDGVLGSSPGYQAFGYTNPGACAVSAKTSAGACTDPEHSFYWLPGTPSAATHRIIADYVNQVLTTCKAT
ncbi:hypothetical protein DXG03_009044 [Asterophora parasitica]|uniref:Carbohydrate esterase family 16 protein n=1 Tax=Asterophora parasitica TaxID=117018 RepID=A0A9P7G753_9AGAR|nr:hypothetical protein DXG03_009044 [Asterophora parasitica]